MSGPPPATGQTRFLSCHPVLPRRAFRQIGFSVSYGNNVSPDSTVFRIPTPEQYDDIDERIDAIIYGVRGFLELRPIGSSQVQDRCINRSIVFVVNGDELHSASYAFDTPGYSYARPFILDTSQPLLMDKVVQSVNCPNTNSRTLKRFYIPMRMPISHFYNPEWDWQFDRHLIFKTVFSETVPTGESPTWEIFFNGVVDWLPKNEAIDAALYSSHEAPEMIVHEEDYELDS